MDAVVPAPLMWDVSVPWSNEAYAVDPSEWRGGACCAPVARELTAASGRFSERWRFKPLSVGLRTLARREIVDTFCEEKGEDAARSVHERIMNGHADKDVDKLQRTVTVLNPASVIPLIPAPAGRLFNAHWRVLFSSPWSRKEHITVLEARALAQTVNVTGGQARGHAARVLFLSDLLAVTVAFHKGRSFFVARLRVL